MNNDLISRKKVMAEIRRIAPIGHKVVGSDAQMILAMVEQLSPEREPYFDWAEKPIPNDWGENVPDFPREGM